MDSDIHTIGSGSGSGSGSKRRRATLTKNPPPSAYPTSSHSVLRKPQSQATLQRAPSAPSPYPRNNNGAAHSARDFHQRTHSSNFASSSSSLEHSSATHSPVIPSVDYFPSTYTYTSHSHRSPQPLSVTPQTSDDRHKDLIGAPFDASGLLLSFQTTVSHSQDEQRQPPSQLTQNNVISDLRYHPLRNSQTIGPGGVTMMEVTPPKSENGILSPKRFSGEAQPSKPPGPLRKKSGFSSFVNNMLGSPRNIKISAPENPMHMIHVGYDNQTGQFTVCTSALTAPSLHFPLIFLPRDFLRIGREFWQTVASPKTSRTKTRR